jgi:hypothetical protein
LILVRLKAHIGNNQQVSLAIPPDQRDAVHSEIASQITNGLKSQTAAQGGAGGLLSMLQGAWFEKQVANITISE